MADLSNLRRPDGATRSSNRVGRGPGSGNGKTSGRGHKGHKARTGTPHRPWFEGGQMPIQRRLPKRGFNNTEFRTEWEIVNLRDLERVDADTITPEILAEHGLVDLGPDRPVKILGEGDVARKLTVRAHRFSASARAKIEAAGGSVEVIGGEAPARRPAEPAAESAAPAEEASGAEGGEA